MAGFKTVREAKVYLADRIAEEAERESAPLTEIERKMLYFTEDGGLSKEMAAVSEEFDRDCDQDIYERRIGGLIARLLDRNDADLAIWDDAASKLAEGDHYLNVLLDQAQSETDESTKWAWLMPWLPSGRPSADPTDKWRLIAAAVLVSALLLAFVAAVHAIRQ